MLTGANLPLRVRGENSLRLTCYFPGSDLAGCVSTFVIRDLSSGVPSTVRLTITSADEEELVLSDATEAGSAGGGSWAVGDGVATLDVDPATIEAIPAGTYSYEWKLIFPAVGEYQRKQPISFGIFERLNTINAT